MWGHITSHRWYLMCWSCLFSRLRTVSLCWLSARSGRKRQQDVAANLSKTETVCGDTDWTVFGRDDMISPSSNCLPSFCSPANCLIIKCFICLHKNTQERDLAFSKRLKKERNKRLDPFKQRQRLFRDYCGSWFTNISQTLHNCKLERNKSTSARTGFTTGRHLLSSFLLQCDYQSITVSTRLQLVTSQCPDIQKSK